MTAPVQIPDRRSEDPLRLLLRIRNKLKTLWVTGTYPFAALGKGISVHHTCDIRREKAHRVKLGDDVTLGKDVWLSITDDAPAASGPVVTLESGCQLGHRTIVSAKNGIHFERDVITAQEVLIMDHSHEYEDITRPIRLQGVTEGGRIRIGEGSWIGHGASIICTRGELRLGRNCVVAANALVTRSFPDYCIISGNPARVVKQYDTAKRTWVLGASRSTETDTTQQEDVTNVGR